MIIPTHKITDHAESGISIRRLIPDIVMPADKPLHRDDYFAFCLLTKGEVSINVDFTEHTLWRSPSMFYHYKNNIKSRFYERYIASLFRFFKVQKWLF